MRSLGFICKEPSTRMTERSSDSESESLAESSSEDASRPCLASCDSTSTELVQLGWLIQSDLLDNVQHRSLQRALSKMDGIFWRKTTTKDVATLENRGSGWVWCCCIHIPMKDIAFNHQLHSHHSPQRLPQSISIFSPTCNESHNGVHQHQPRNKRNPLLILHTRRTQI